MLWPEPIHASGYYGLTFALCLPEQIHYPAVMPISATYRPLDYKYPARLGDAFGERGERCPKASEQRPVRTELVGDAAPGYVAVLHL